MGKGVVKADGSSFENQCSTHGQPLSKSGADVSETIARLGGDPQNPWIVFGDVRALYEERRKRLRAVVAERRKAYDRWAEANPDKALQLKSYLEGRLPEIDYAAIPHKPNVATRTASADVLSVLGEKVGNMIVSSADLANSDKSEAFLKKTGAFTPGDFSGAFLHAGVAELTMASIINGIALHGGVIGACATFFVFSDYMKPAMRIASLMELPVKYIWSHDAFRVGEDGPTHEPIEQEAQLRLLEEVKNFSGHPSLLAMRPADSAETTVCWMMAMNNMHSPSALVLTRQDVNDLPSASGDRYRDALQAQKGGYTVISHDNPDIILVANGSEVSLLCDVSVALATEGIRANVVSMPSIGLFNTQDESYRDSVLPAGITHFGLTAGLPLTILMIKGFNGEVYGMERFGASAPYKVLDEKFGFTVSNILARIKQILG